MTKKFISILLITLCMIAILCGCNSKSEVKNVEVKTGYTNCAWANKNVVCCGIEVTNPNEDKFVQNVNIRATAYDESGSVLESATDSITEIAPNTTEATAIQLWIDTQASKVEFKLDEESITYVSENNAKGKGLKPLTITNISKIPNSFGCNITGEIQNENDSSITCSNTCVIFKDDNGNIKGGQFIQVSPVAKNDKTPFSISVNFEEMMTENYTVYPTIFIF